MNASFLTVYEIIGLVLTVVSAIIAYQTVANDKEAKEKKTSGKVKKQTAAFVALLSLILTFMLSIRYDKLVEVRERLVLLADLGEGPRAKSFATAAAEASRIAHPDSNPVIRELVSFRLNSIERELRQIGRGEIQVQGTDLKELALRLVNSTTRKIAATSYVTPTEWWDTAWGRRYDEANAEAARRNVEIRRVFIFPNVAERGRLWSMLQDQVKKGMIVRTVAAPDLDKTLARDMVIIDERIAGVLNLVDRSLSGARFTLDTDEVWQIQRDFEKIWALAEPVTIDHPER